MFCNLVNSWRQWKSHMLTNLLLFRGKNNFQNYGAILHDDDDNDDDEDDFLWGKVDRWKLI